jgi:TolB-like protein
MPASSGEFTNLEQPAVRVFTLGRFQVEVEGAPLRFGRKAQRRPLDLLKLLIAYGGDGISAGQLADDLWPDAEGDAALAALRTTLSRLRKLIGADAVLSDARGLALNPQVCWVDALALHQLLAGANGGPQDALGEALFLYRGELLPGEGHLPPVLCARAKLHRLVLRHVIEHGQRFEQAGLTERAMALYRRGLELDGNARDVARRLERLCAELPVFSGALASELTIAVLSFEDLSPQGDHQRLADAIRETVISLLGTLPHLTLLTKFNLGLPHRDSPVRYLLQGDVMASGNRLRATAHLVDARTGQHAWSEQLDHTLHEVIESQDRIAVEMADGLARKLVFGDVGQLLLSANVHVWKNLAQARMLLDRHTRQDHQRARALIRRMLEIEGEEPLIRGLLAIAHVIESWKCWTANPAASLHATEKELRGLRRRYGRSAQGLHSLSWVCALRGDIDEALRIARRNVDWMPENFKSHAFLGLPLAYQGRYAHALDKFNDAFRARPQPLHWLCKDRAAIQFCMGRYDEAASGLKMMLVDEYPLHRDADLLSARLMYVGSLAAAGRAEQARHEARATLAVHPNLSVRDWCLWQFQPYRDKSPASRMERLLLAAGLPH